ncbi:HD domain-containing protein [Clostridium coskatii]|uniref:3'-5' exoribonuclease YhaM n=1 Tax=Clostridium coskatii TaxID=1705578 RepID=A0A166RH79_9CLOT|nr:HD domain-containing protein [Clostridium coskatii]OAA90800.1 HD domain protein [Clostridium coskatii]OAA93031.1 HD domain protein [Clostridium coskatii]OBR90424.1 3'-5' exoribonuclease YhaM [Clostridium coskatii]
MKSEEIKDKIIDLLINTDRKGIERVIKYLEESDFFGAPASTRYHGNYKGGLAEHSLNVYEIFKKKNIEYDFGLSDDTVKITALLHDLCKANFYTVSSRNMKKDGKWIKVPYYAVEDQSPFGHGEKSVILLQQFIRLSKEEILIIRWHMGGYEPSQNYNNISNAWNMCKAGVALHTADLESSYILETHFEPGENSKQMSFKA